MDRILAEHIMPTVEAIAEAENSGTQLVDPAARQAQLAKAKPKLTPDQVARLAAKHNVDPTVVANPFFFSDGFERGIDMVIVAYVALLVGGGVLAYGQAGSLKSLRMAGFAAVVASVAGGMMYRNPRNLIAHVILFGLAIVLSGVFLKRFWITWTFFPTGWLLFNSAVVALRYGERMLYLTKKEDDKAKEESKPKTE